MIAWNRIVLFYVFPIGLCASGCKSRTFHQGSDVKSDAADAKASTRAPFPAIEDDPAYPITATPPTDYATDTFE